MTEVYASVHHIGQNGGLHGRISTLSIYTHSMFKSMNVLDHAREGDTLIGIATPDLRAQV